MSVRRDNVDTVVSLFQLYEQKMYHIAFAILRDSYQAEDAVMDAFVRLLDRNYPIGDPASREAKSLVIQIIRSSAIDLYRKNRKERERQVLAEDPAALSPERSGELELPFSGSVEPMIRDLPEIYRDVIRLRYAKDFTVAETARALGIREETVRKRQERALRMLKDIQFGNGGQPYGKQSRPV